MREDGKRSVGKSPPPFLIVQCREGDFHSLVAPRLPVSVASNDSGPAKSGDLESDEARAMNVVGWPDYFTLSVIPPCTQNSVAGAISGRRGVAVAASSKLNLKLKVDCVSFTVLAFPPDNKLLIA
jgi:hypothetical protein